MSDNTVGSDQQAATASGTETAARPSAKREWLSDIECLKGFAILLVVWGHVHDPGFASWALDLRHAIYAFHMPLFMFLSGYVFVHVGAQNPHGNIGGYTRKRAVRLLVPFIVMAAIVIFGKLAAGLFLRVDKPVNDVAHSFWSVFFNTEESPVQFIWYLIILFYLSILTAVLHSRFHVSLTSLLVLSLLMHVAHVTLFYQGITLDFLYFNRVLMYYVFFMIGCVASEKKDLWLGIVDRYWLVAGALFLGFEYFLFDSEWRYLFAGATSTVLVHGLIRKFFNGNRVLTFFGENAFAIYLFNMLFIGIVKGVFAKFAPVAAHPGIVIPLCTIVALAGAIAIRFTVNRFEVLKPVARAIE